MPVLRHLHSALLLLLRAEVTLRVHVGVERLILGRAPTRVRDPKKPQNTAAVTMAETMMMP